MAFVANDYQQFSLGDSFNNLSERSRKFVLNSCAKDFAEDVFPVINEERFSVLYSSNKAARPNAPVNVIIGSLILKEILSLTDDELLGSAICDIRFQYALHTSSFTEQPLSDRSFSRFRERCYLYEQEYGRDLVQEEVLSLADAIAKLMKMNPSLKRMDSLMIASNCKKMTRLDVLYTCLANMAEAVHKTGEDTLLSGMEHYLDEDDHNRVIYHNKSEETDSKIQQIINDSTELIDRMGEAYFELPEYQLLHRVLTEQSAGNGNGTRTAKDKKDIAPDSLQNPSDPDATYREKAGKDNKGYVGHVVETFDGKGNSVITGYGYEQNSHSDSAFCRETIASLAAEEGSRPQGVPTMLIADGAYGGTGNQKLAKENNIDLKATSLVGRLPDEIHADFTMSEDGRQVISCPAGNTPVRNTYNPVSGQCRAVMERNQCKGCPHRNQCKARLQKKSAVVNVSVKMVQRARQMAEMTTDEYVQLSRKRNGVESIPSVMRRKYDVDHIPVRGKQKSRLFFGFKVAALNFNKLRRYYRYQQENYALKMLTA